VGFLARMFVPRSVRRAAHPGRAVKRAVTPKAVRRARRLAHPVSNASYAFERSLTTRRRTSGGRVYRHGGCPVRHRSAQAAARCRNR
jgi:hypothetical protein